ncbi:DUF4240 domain-containing protein [Actinoplanes subtropicus]|uniref:DUF4240 domain-containing protein n=1 Tax=Actinoplanes subtropicus TaxID=543632 RepID=UPI0009FDC75F|nr:DUF4240 domain-containing protein [Actinoplanes subtropicus]
MTITLMWCSAGVDLEEFWALIERSGRESADPEERTDRLTDELAAYEPDDIVDFQLHVDALRDRVDNHRLWGAAWLVCGGVCDEDGFWYFQAWLIGQGRDVYEAVAADPDALADVPAVRELAGRDSEDWDEAEWPGWESLDDVAEDAYEEATDGDLERVLLERGHDFRLAPQPTDASWDFEDDEEMERRYPRLTKIF